MIPFPRNFRKRQTHRDRRERSSFQELGEGSWEQLLNGEGGFSGDGENVPKQHCECIIRHRIVHFTTLSLVFSFVKLTVTTFKFKNKYESIWESVTRHAASPGVLTCAPRVPCSPTEPGWPGPPLLPLETKEDGGGGSGWFMPVSAVWSAVTSGQGDRGRALCGGGGQGPLTPCLQHGT